MVKTNIQTFTGEVEILKNLFVGSNLLANDVASNVLNVTGRIGATNFIGDGGLLSNIATTLDQIVDQGNTVSNTIVFVSGNDATSNTGIMTYANVGISISNTNPTGEFQLSIGSNVFVNTHASNALTVVGRLGATNFIGDGGLLSNIATTLDQIVDQGNTVSNTIIFVSGNDVTTNTGIVTHENVGISISNVNPSGVFQFGVGSNLFVNVYSSNILVIEGNVSAEKMTLGTISVTSAYGLNHVTNQGSTTGDTITLTNATTGLVAASNIVVGGNVSASNVLASGNVEVGNRLKFSGSNVFVDDLRIADLAANLVTYDKTTGELMDSGGLFANKLVVVSVQPPSVLTGNTTTITKHGTYTVSTSSLAANSDAWNAFDGTVAEWTSSTVAGTLYNAGESVYGGTSNLFTGNYIQPGVSSAGEWLAVEFPYKTTLRHMKLTPPATLQRYPASANVYATNDSVTWTELTQWEDVIPTDTTPRTILVNASEAFKKYAMVVTKSAGITTNVALADWKLFTESFSISGGEISMAQQPTTGGETVMDQHGPHGRGAARLKKYPEIIFDASKADVFGNSNAYAQAGYEISSTSRFSTSYDVLSAFNGTYLTDHFASPSLSYSTSSPFNYTLFTNNVTDKDSTQYTGEEIKIKLPNKIKLSKLHIVSYVGAYGRKVASGHIFGSNTGVNGSWTKLTDFSGLNTGTSGHETVSVSTTDYYEWYSLVVTNLNGGDALLNIYELEYYGYEELATQGDTSVDTTFTSIMNTPQTTGANVYIDGNLGETFTNRVTGPDATGPSATYDSTGKYWELNGTLTSNIAVEANTFLEGDQPHSVSVWFNSSNLEANVSNTCVFSISDQEKLDSVNLDLQSNTWHNLTYAYQGEGGSRVTYLDGRKVAEDQAEDTFGDYPPFAMTGYSQGGYVVSASNEYTIDDRLAWKAYDVNEDDTSTNAWMTKDPSWDINSTPSTPIDSPDTFTVGGVNYTGHWNKLELPHKLKVDYVYLSGRFSDRVPYKGVFLGSNDDSNWEVIKSFDGTLTWTTVSGIGVNTHVTGITNQNAYKYILLLVQEIVGPSTRLWLSQIQYYGHKEGDLVRFPDPTNVLKYPHVAMTGPAQRGYVASASTEYPTYSACNGFDDIQSAGGIQNHWSASSAKYNTSDGNWSGDTASVYTTNVEGVNKYGDWLQIEFPHKIKYNYSQIKAPYDSVERQPRDGYIVGSNDLSGQWTTLHRFTGVTRSSTTETVTYTPSSASTTAFKYIRLVIEAITASVGQYAGVDEWNIFGTGVDSIPLQIGGGNIDKVANFRVYDKFIGEDQALEIWDAQKDEFGRAKSSMTLHKGRLGIGTTEPQGRLAVLDEPHNLEEFPPRAMTGYKNYFEGHGEFCASSSTQYNDTGHQVWRVFDKIDALGYSGAPDAWYSGNGTFYNGTDNAYSGTSQLASGVPLGDYIKLELPYRVNVKEFVLNGPNTESEFPRDFTFYGSNDNKIWNSILSVTNAILGTNSTVSRSGVGDTLNYLINSSTFYKYYAIVITKGNSFRNTYVGIDEWRLFGTREQGQSVLHDGQLTLTKNLNVPRIGPALDADDTPRRDRLVVEYNTSTNPTFEGVVRDTSGRGFHGALFGGASYDATQKALVFDGTDDYIFTGNLQNSGGDIDFTISMWIKPGAVTSSTQSPFLLGKEVTNKAVGLNFTATNVDFFVVGGAAYNYTTSGIFDTGSWKHFILYRRGGLMGVYVNGVYITPSVTGSGSLDLHQTTQFTLGNRDGINYFNGSISQFKLYDTALTAEEVKTLYDMGRCDEGHHVVNFSKTRVGIGLGDGEAPRGALDVRGETPFIGPGLVIHQAASGNWGTEGDPANMNGLLLTLEGETGLTTGSSYWNIAAQATGNSSLLFAHRGKATAFIDLNNSGNSLDFTGQHRTFIKDVPFSQAGDLEGLIVSSDQNKYIKISGGIETGSNAIMINESLPVVSLSTTTNDKKCFGVISASEDPEQRSDSYGSFVTPFEKEKGDTRVYINSVGEGAIWVSNIGGNLEAGDYITTSNVAGYGQKQESDSLKNYTVAKITMDCDFEPVTQPIQQILRSNVIQTYYLGNVHHTKTVPHEFVTTTVGVDDVWSNVSVSPSDVTYTEWSNLEANTQNTYTLTYTQTSNVVYDTKYTLTTTANVTESDPWDRVFVDPPDVTYAQYSNLEANTQSSYSLTFTQTTTDEKTPGAWSNLESNTQSLYNEVYYQSVEEEVASEYPGATTHTRVTDVIENELDEHGQIQWEDHATETEKAYKIRYLDVSGTQTDSANAVHIAAFVGCTYHCG